MQKRTKNLLQATCGRISPRAKNFSKITLSILTQIDVSQVRFSEGSRKRVTRI